MPVKILHAADFHMDSPFASLTDEQAAERRREQRALLAELASLASDEKVDIVLLAGDLFDSGVSYWETQETLLATLSAIKVPVFIAPGNHDYYCTKSPYAFLTFPDNVHIFTSSAIRPVELPELNCRVWGAGFTSQLCKPMLTGFTAPDDGVTDVMVLHGEMGGERYAPIDEAEIAASGLDYLALGHVHAYSGIKTAGKTHYAYPGCIEGRGFDETGDKGVIIATVAPGKCDAKFVPLSGRKYAIEEFDVSGTENVADAIAEKFSGRYENDVVRFVLTGEYDGEVDTDAVAAALKGKFYGVSVKSRILPRRDIWAGLGEDSLRGIFLSRLREKYDAAEGDEKELIADAVRCGVDALDMREADVR